MFARGQLRRWHGELAVHDIGEAFWGQTNGLCGFPPAGFEVVDGVDALFVSGFERDLVERCVGHVEVGVFVFELGGERHDFGSSGGERSERFVGDAFDFPYPCGGLLPADAEVLGEVPSLLGCSERCGGGDMEVEVAAIEGPAVAVGVFDGVEDNVVHVQERVLVS